MADSKDQAITSNGHGISAAMMEGIIAWQIIPTYGEFGAAIATFIGFTLLTVFTFIINQLIYPITFPWGRVLRVALFFTGIVFLQRYFAIESLLVRFILVLSYPIVLLLSGYLDKDEWAAYRKWSGKS